MNPLDIERGGPAVPGEAELGQPLVRPAGDDGLAGRVARGMVVEATLRTGLGVIAHPDTAIDGVDRLPIGQGVTHQQGAEGRHIDAASSKGGVETAPTAPVGRGQAQVDG